MVINSAWITGIAGDHFNGNSHRAPLGIGDQTADDLALALLPIRLGTDDTTDDLGLYQVSLTAGPRNAQRG